jgi:hypothetical protein
MDTGQIAVEVLMCLMTIACIKDRQEVELFGNISTFLEILCRDK